eukprot:gene7375-5190_t
MLGYFLAPGECSDVPEMALSCLGMMITRHTFACPREGSSAASVTLYSFSLFLLTPFPATAGRPLRVFLNGISGRSFQLAVPDAIDTLAELCHFITAEVPLPGPPTASNAGRAIRFLYSTAGTPLWRVPECLELGSIVVSERPGFIPRNTIKEARGAEAAGAAQRVDAAPLGTQQRGASASPIPSRPTPREPLQHQVDTTTSSDPHYPPDAFDANAQQFTSLGSSSSVAFMEPDVSPAVAEWNPTATEMLLARKWKTFQTVRRRQNLLAQDEVRQWLDNIAKQRRAAASGTPLRIMVSGPPGSGVSTTAAMLVQEIFLTRTESSSGNALCGHLLVPLDLALLLSDEAQSPPQGADLLYYCEVVLHAAMDAAAAGRRSLRMSGATLAEFWMSALYPTGSRTSTAYLRHEAVTAVGEGVVQEWETFFAPTEALLREAVALPGDMGLRDEVLRFVFRDMAVELARSLGFVGVFFFVDGLEQLSRGARASVARPLGDVTPVLRALCDAERSLHIHVILASSSSSIQSIGMAYIPGLTAWIKTIGLVEKSHAERLLPQHLHSFSDMYSLDVFLWAPGYLSLVQAYCVDHKASRNADVSVPQCTTFNFPSVRAALRNLQRVTGIEGVPESVWQSPHHTKKRCFIVGTFAHCFLPFRLAKSLTLFLRFIESLV